jgi:hypothetical protein
MDRYGQEVFGIVPAALVVMLPILAPLRVVANVATA